LLDLFGSSIEKPQFRRIAIRNTSQLLIMLLLLRESADAMYFSKRTKIQASGINSPAILSLTRLVRNQRKQKEARMSVVAGIPLKNPRYIPSASSVIITAQIISSIPRVVLL
jgi:hypothetical protein